MTTLHHRSASATDRRSANANNIPSRGNSSRLRHPEQNSTREVDSPPLSDGSEDGIDGGFRRHERRLSNLEHRRVKSTITTTEALLKRRSPMKETINIAGRNAAADKQRRSQESPLARRVGKNIDTSLWMPTVSLKAHSSAPLSTRVNFPPVSRDAPSELEAVPLSNLSKQEQERSILDDLLYVFMGYEGQYIRFSDVYNPTEEKDRLAGPSFQPLSGLDPSLKDLTTSMLTMATHYCAIEAFVEVQSREEYGSVNHALCAAIRKLLKDYLILVAQLEMKILDDSNFTLHQMRLAVIPTAQSLTELYALAQELLKKNSLLEEDLDDSMNEFDADNIIERLREGGDLLPGSMTKKKCIGGNVLALLTQRLATYSGDPAARTILEILMREASRPYMKMLNEWLHHGGINDPYSEFLIGERSSIKRERLDEDYTDEYWEKRYYIRDKEVPPQLEVVKDKVLLAGKYLNVVRECGGVNVTSKITDTPSTFDDTRFLDNINNAYSFANHDLLNLLLTTNSLHSRLRSMKHYFFLDQAEFFFYFLELSDSELQKPHRSVNTGKLQSLLDIVLHQPGSIAMADPYKEDVKVKMNEMGLTQWLMKIVTVQGMDQDNPDSMIEQYKAPATATSKEDDKEINGYEALELDYFVPFPLSLIISRKTVLRYQLIFRYTLALRHLESSLVDCWSEHSKSKAWTHKSSDKRIEIWKRRIWTLRARMLVFVQQMLFFATAEVIEPNWRKLMAKVNDTASMEQNDATVESGLERKSKRTVDELMQDHLDMLDSCMKDLGLTQGKLLKIHSKLMFGCTMFAKYTSRQTKTLSLADPDLFAASIAERSQETNATSSATAAPPAQGYDPNRFVQLEESARRYEEHFNRHLKVLIESLNYYAATETVVLLSLCGRLKHAEVQNREEFSV